MRGDQARLGRAVVIGGSMAGLLAARVLADYFQRVIVIERDRRSARPDFRKGVPQGRHAHALLVKGDQIISRWFPGIRYELLSAGAMPVNMGRDLRWHHFGVWKSRYDSALEGISLSRPLLEWTIGERVRRLPNVEFIEGCATRKLDIANGRVTGVHLRGGESRGGQQYLPADLVIDASGRGSTTPMQLTESGFARPPESAVVIDLVYASRILQAPVYKRTWKALYAISQPPNKRGALIVPIEDGRWLATAFGFHGDHPPSDESGFLDFFKSLPVPDLYSALTVAEPISDITRHGTPSSLRRHYEQLKHFPEGLLVTGDAICSFNPTFGQGMSTAALYAEVLQRCLSTHVLRGNALFGLWKEFFRGAAAAADAPWQLATTEDFRHSETIGPRSPTMRLLHWYTQKAHIASGHDPRVTERVYEVMHLLKPPQALFSPDILRRVLGGGSAAVPVCDDFADSEATTLIRPIHDSGT